MRGSLSSGRGEVCEACAIHPPDGRVAFVLFLAPGARFPVAVTAFEIDGDASLFQG